VPDTFPLASQVATQGGKMIGFIVVENDYNGIAVDELAQRLNQQWLPIIGYTGSAKWYYDDDNFESGTEYGVKLDIQATTNEESFLQLRVIWDLCLKYYPHLETRLEIPPQ
jgi:hypothetical protein